MQFYDSTRYHKCKLIVDLHIWKIHIFKILINQQQYDNYQSNASELYPIQIVNTGLQNVEQRWSPWQHFPFWSLLCWLWKESTWINNVTLHNT